MVEALTRGLHRSGDLLARYGGEEFAILLPEADLRGAAALAESLRATVEGLGIAHAGSSVSGVVTVSLGVAVLVLEGEAPPADLVQRADRALYRAKREGRNRVFRAA